MARKKFIYAIYTPNDELIGVFDSIKDILWEFYKLKPGMQGYNLKFISLCAYINRYSSRNDEVKHYKWKIYKLERGN